MRTAFEQPDVHTFEAELREYMRTRYPHLLDQINETGEMDEDAMRAAIEGFTSSWVSSGHTTTEEHAARRAEQADARAMRAGEHSRPVGEA